MLQMANGGNSGGMIARPVTSYQVAEAAGVSQSTVSLVLSGRAEGRVSPATRNLVLKTARKLGYQRNELARILRTGESRMLALAVPNVRQPFFGQILVAAELAARENDYSVILIDTATDAAWTSRLLAMFHSKVIAGCIVYAGDDTALPDLVDVRDRLLLIEDDNRDRSSIDIDVDTGLREVVEHFAALGHRNIAYFAADYPKVTYRRRFESFLHETKRLGLRHAPEWLRHSTFEIEKATETATKLLSLTEFTAVFCDDDLLAAGLYRAARLRRLRIPDQLSVIGFNDIELARALDPELTTVAIPADEIGAMAVTRLLSVINGYVPDSPFISPLRLVTRASTGRYLGKGDQD